MRFDAGFLQFPRWWWGALENAPAAWVKVWLFVALNANIRPGLFMGRTIQPCQFAYSLASLARQCGVSVQQARAAVGNMQKARAATIETTHHYSLITLINAQGCGVSLPGRQHSEEQSAQHELQQANNTRGNNNKKNKERRIEREAKFSPPTPADVSAYVLENSFSIDGQQFCDYYASKGWLVGKTGMKDWRAALRTWARRETPTLPSQRPIADPGVGYTVAAEWKPDPTDNTLFDLSLDGKIIEIPRSAPEGAL